MEKQQLDLAENSLLMPFIRTIFISTKEIRLDFFFFFLAPRGFSD